MDLPHLSTRAFWALWSSWNVEEVERRVTAGLAETGAEKQPAVVEMRRQVKETGSFPLCPAPTFVKRQLQGTFMHSFGPLLLVISGNAVVQKRGVILSRPHSSSAAECRPELM